MQRVIVLAALIVVGSLSYAVSAYQQGAQPANRTVEVEKLKDNLWVLKGGGGNTAVFVTTAGVTVVDTKNPGWGQPVLDEIKKLTPKPITTIINTHTHGDHVSGNVEFPATVDVVVHENTKANMEKMTAPTGFPPATSNIFTVNNGRGMAKRTYKDKMTIGSGADQVDLHYFGRAHTNGDTFVVFTALRTMHAGDAFAGKGLPLLDTNNGGSGVEIGDTLAKAAQVPNIDTIITGHSTQMTVADLRQFSDFNKDFLAAVREAKKANKTVDEVATTWKIPAKYTGYGEPQAARLKANVQAVWDEVR